MDEDVLDFEPEDELVREFAKPVDPAPPKIATPDYISLQSANAAEMPSSSTKVDPPSMNMGLDDMVAQGLIYIPQDLKPKAKKVKVPQQPVILPRRDTFPITVKLDAPEAPRKVDSQVVMFKPQPSQPEIDPRAIRNMAMHGGVMNYLNGMRQGFIDPKYNMDTQNKMSLIQGKAVNVNSPITTDGGPGIDEKLKSFGTKTRLNTRFI